MQRRCGLLALASATVFEGHKTGLRVVGVTVDHGLQPGSDAQAERVVAQLAALGVDETLAARVQVDTAAGIGPEAAAREARYAVLEQVAEHLGARAVLLGHTLDDQAETVLLGLARGSGGRSLQGMRPGFGVFVRPLLGVRRDDTVSACLVEGLDAWYDPHNHDPGYTRVRVRERVLPVLEAELGPGSPPRWRARPTSCATTPHCSTSWVAGRTTTRAATAASTSPGSPRPTGPYATARCATPRSTPERPPRS